MFWKRRIPFLVSVALVLAGAWLVVRWVRGRNSPPIPPRGGDPFTNFASLHTDFYLQRDPRWKDEAVGGSRESLGQVGCVVASLAMGLSHYGIRMTPAQLNDWLKTNGGYTSRGWLRWNAVARLTAGKVSAEVLPKPTHGHLDAALRGGQPVLVKVLLDRLIPHWVLVVGKEGQEYLIRDPLGEARDPTPLSSYDSDIYGVRILKPVGSDVPN
jgi:hypothetical protein